MSDTYIIEESESLDYSLIVLDYTSTPSYKIGYTKLNDNQDSAWSLKDVQPRAP